jgi:hypothetical protein
VIGETEHVKDQCKASVLSPPGRPPAADAKAMLEKTVAAIKADKAKTLDQINNGENGFLVSDLYPFCFNLIQR